MTNNKENKDTRQGRKRGQSGNPKGRPISGFLGKLFDECTREFMGCDHMVVTITTRSPDGLQETFTLDSKLDGWFAIATQRVALQLVSKAVQGDPQAIKLLMDFTEGKVPNSDAVQATSPAFTKVWPDKEGNIIRQSTDEAGML